MNAEGSRGGGRSCEQRSLERGGARLAYLDTGGDGETVVILHGLAGSGREFLATAAALPEYRVLLPDLRGHGHSTRQPGELSRAAFVGDIVDLIDRAIGGPVDLVGQSMGAHTAMLVAAARPDLVKRLVLLEASAEGTGADQPKSVAGFFRSWPVPFPDAQAAHDFLGDDPLARAWIADLEITETGLRPRFDPDVMEQVLWSMTQPRWSEWERTNPPTLVVYAENGMFTAEQQREFIARGRSVERADIAGASHDAHLDAFDAWAAALRSFLLRTP